MATQIIKHAVMKQVMHQVPVCFNNNDFRMQLVLSIITMLF